MDETKMEYQVMTADIDEKAITAGLGDRETCDPNLLTVAVASAKADEIIKKLKSLEDKEDYLLITADQVVQYDGRIREKPIDEEQCRKHLKSYIQQPAVMVSGLVVTNTKTGERFTGVDKSVQYFKPFPDELVEDLIKEGSIMNTCGSLRIDAGKLIVKTIKQINKTIKIFFRYVLWILWEILLMGYIDCNALQNCFKLINL